ncbi:MAG: hypothetical protein ABEI86_00045 [Halobacteriaceae archaeon]
MLDSDRHLSFSEIRSEVNAIVANDSRGASETIRRGEYSPAALSSLLSAAKDADIVAHELVDGEKRWRLRQSELSQIQINRIESENRADKVHTDLAGIDINH